MLNNRIPSAEKNIALITNTNTFLFFIKIDKISITIFPPSVIHNGNKLKTPTAKLRLLIHISN